MKRIYRYPQINWERDRLQPYESIYSFAAKFCALNGIKEKTFREFMGEYFLNHHWQTYGFNLHEGRRLSKLLDEPYSVTKTLASQSINLPLSFCSAVVSQNSVSNGHTLSYCTNCIRLGYHAKFHDYLWLDKCVIHGERLIRVWFRESGGGLRNFDGQVSALRRILSDHDPAWLKRNIKNGLWSDKKVKKRLSLFVNWITQLNSTIFEFEKNCLAIRNYYDVNYDNLSTLLCYLNWANRIPDQVKGLLSTDFLEVQPRIVEIDTEPLDELASLFAGNSIDEVIWFYLKTLALTGEYKSYLEKVKAVAEELARHASNCNCHWSLETTTHSWVHSSIAIGDKCPFEVAHYYLRKKWLDFITEMMSCKDRTWEIGCYIHLTKQFLKHGLVKIVDDGEEVEFNRNPVWDIKPYVTWIGNIKTTATIDKIISEQIEKDISGLRGWIDHLNDSERPPAISHAIGSINVFRSDKKSYMFLWPGLYNNN